MADDRLLLDVADAVASREEVDWRRCVPRTVGEDRRVVANLRALADLFPPRARRPTAARDPTRREPFAGRRALNALLAVAGIEWAASVAALPWTGDAYQRVYGPAATYLGVILIGYGACAAPLLLGGRRDERAWLLGVYFALLASIPAAHMLPFLLWGAAPDGAAGYSIYLHPFVFRSAVLWQFTRTFPRVHRRSRIDDLARRMVPAAAIFGLAAGAAFIPLHGLAGRGAVPPDALAAYQDATLALLTLLDAAAIVALLFRARGAPADEFARIALFAGGFLIWSAGSAVYDVLEVLRPGSFLSNMAPTPFVFALAVVRLGCLSLMGYAVLARRALDVRVTIRASYRRLLARRLLGVAAAAPAAALAGQVVIAPDRSVGALLADPWVGMLATATGAALVAAIGRRRLLGRLETRVHPQSAEQGRLLAVVGVALASAADVSEVGAVVARCAHRGCGLPASLLVAPALAGRSPGTPASFVGASPATAPLELTSAIAYVVKATRRSIPVAPDAPGSAFDLLRGGDAAWVASTSSAVVVPVTGTGMDTVGMVAVGRRRDDRLPSPFDVTFVEMLASAAGLALERLRHASSGSVRAGARGAAPPAARECPACGRLAPPEVSEPCGCGAVMAPASVPARLAGALRLERRLGAGGMGTVYLAWDDELERSVAVKTLASPSVDALARLKQEARVMAAISHPSIAQIYGLESWRGRPLLLVEFLAGGTLADRLRAGPIRAAEAVVVAVTVAGALEALHAAAYLHRDVKPSNIGFTSSGSAKLFDVGLACLLETDEAPASGTLPYLSPELLRGGAPGAADDVWALAVVLYEMVAGRHPFAAASRPQVIDRILGQRIAPCPAAGGDSPTAPSSVIAFAAELLTTAPTARIATPRAFADALRAF